MVDKQRVFTLAVAVYFGVLLTCVAMMFIWVANMPRASCEGLEPEQCGGVPHCEWHPVWHSRDRPGRCLEVTHECGLYGGMTAILAIIAWAWIGITFIEDDKYFYERGYQMLVVYAAVIGVVDVYLFIMWYMLDAMWALVVCTIIFAIMFSVVVGYGAVRVALSLEPRPKED
jgi:hypothetical protein